jgi:hypothetical protein
MTRASALSMLRAALRHVTRPTLISRSSNEVAAQRTALHRNADNSFWSNHLLLV